MQRQKVCLSETMGGSKKAYWDITTNYNQQVWQLNVLKQQQKSPSWL